MGVRQQFLPVYDQLSVLVMIAQTHYILMEKIGSAKLKNTRLEKMAAIAEKARAAKNPSEITELFGQINNLIKEKLKKAA